MQAELFALFCAFVICNAQSTGTLKLVNPSIIIPEISLNFPTVPSYLDKPSKTEATFKCPNATSRQSTSKSFCVHTFGQNYTSLSDLSSSENDVKLVEPLLNGSWSTVLSEISSSFWRFKLLEAAKNVARYEITVSKPLTSQSLLTEYIAWYKTTIISSDRSKLLGQPWIIYDACIGFVCSTVNAVCSVSLGKAKCICRPGYVGDPHAKCSASCSARTIGLHSFPETLAGKTAVSIQTCPEGFPQASLICRQPFSDQIAKFDDGSLTVVACNATVAKTLSQAMASQLTTESAQNTSNSLLLLTTNSSNLSSNEVSQVISFLETVANSASTKSIQVTSATLHSLVTVSSRLAGDQGRHSATKDVFEGTATSTKLRQAVPRSLAVIAMLSQFEANRTSTNIETGSILVQVQNHHAVQSLFFNSTTSSEQGQPVRPVNVIVPASVTAQAWKTQSNRPKRDASQNPRRSSFIFYKDGSFFRSDENVSYVVSLDLGVNVTLQNLSESIRIQHLGVKARFGKIAVPGNEYKSVKTTLECKYWDFELSRWSSDGCCLSSSVNDTPECSCNHLTNFALLVKSDQVPSNYALSVVSAIGMSLSIIALVFTSVVIAAIREVRKFRSAKVMLHICCNLICAYITFLVGASQTQNEAACISVTILLHFFFLASWCWMSVYSYDMYSSLVKVFASHSNHFIWLSGLFSYGVPALIVTITASVFVGHFDKLQQQLLCNGVTDYQSSYHAENVCWLKGSALSFGFLVPVALMLVYNCVIFVVVTIVLNRRNKEVQAEAFKRTAKQSLLLAATMIFITGVMWVFGYLILISKDHVFVTLTSWIFAVLCSLQGVGIFVMTTLRRADMRNAWLDPIKKKVQGNKHRVSSPPTRSGATAKVNASSSRDDEMKDQYRVSEVKSEK